MRSLQETKTIKGVQKYMPDSTQDGVLAGSLITAPAWAPLLSTFNEILTAATLVIGLVRLWILLRPTIQENQDKQD